jgi:hypothetical protein
MHLGCSLVPPNRKASMTVRAGCVLAMGLSMSLGLGCGAKAADINGPSGAGGDGASWDGAGGRTAVGAGGSNSLTFPSQCNGSGYACWVPRCSSNSGTKVIGKVYDPAGKNPVYGAMVYFPAQLDSLASISSGPGNLCGRCVEPSGNPVAGAISGPDGSFVIERAPVGRQIPLVVQLGKWRRVTFIDVTTACGDNPISEADLVRLPRSRSDGQKVSLPRIAVAAGAGDRVQCLLRRMGIEASEFTNPDGLGSVNIYNQPSALGADPAGRYDGTINGGVAFPDAAGFWSDINQLNKYDIVVLACGGNAGAADPTRTIPNPITDAAKASMVKYLSGGGRVLGEHYHSAWIRSFPPRSSQQSNAGVASPLGADVASWYANVEPTDATSSAVPAGTTVDGRVDTSFAKGLDFANWLVAAKAAEVVGTFPLKGDVKRTALDELSASPSAQRWIYQPVSDADLGGAAAYTHFLSFNMTSGGQLVDRRATDANNLCGRFVYTGLHVDSADTSMHTSDLDDSARTAPFPSCCAAGELGPEEKAIEFMLLDLSSCLSLDADPAAGGLTI